MLAFADGGRLLVDARGEQLLLRPSAWEHGEELVRWLDGATPSNRIINTGLRWSEPTGSEAHALWTVRSMGASRRAAADESFIGVMRLDLPFLTDPLPHGVPEARRSLPAAVLVAWLAHRHLLAPWVEAALPQTLAAFREGRVALDSLLGQLGWSVCTDLVRRDVVVFVAALMAPRDDGVPEYARLLDDAAGAAGSRWQLVEQDAPEVWSRLDDRLRRWRPPRGTDLLSSRLSPDPPPLPVAPSRCQAIS